MLMLRLHMEEFGMSALVSPDAVADAADVVLWFTLLNCDDACEIRGLPRQIRSLLDGTSLKAEVADLICGRQGGRRFLVTAGQTDVTFCSDLAEVVATKAIVLCDLEGIALDLMARCQRALFRIEFDDRGHGAATRGGSKGRHPHLRLV